MLMNTELVRLLFSSIYQFSVIMARTAGLNILGLVLASWIAKTSLAQNASFSCGSFKKTVLASALYNTTVTSPNYPSGYGNNQECTLLIKVDNSHLLHPFIVKVTFNDFQLGSQCVGDFLKFYDGMNIRSSLLGSYCGTTHPEVIYSTGLYLYVKFYTNIFFTYRGFSFSFSAVKEEEASGICRPSYGSSKVHYLSGSSGTFFTPDYPVAYPDDATCIWIITVPARKRVKLIFEDFDFGTVSSSCKDLSNGIDFVQIRDGQDSKSKELGLYCGYDDSTPSDVYSTERYMWVKFYSTSQSSAHWQGGKGFKVHFEAVELSPSSKEMCLTGNLYNNNLTLSGSYGTLQSPQDPKYYPPGSSCDWLITVPEGKIVKLRFDRFELRPSFRSSCTEDYVEILDGKSRYSGTKGIFCGYTKPEDIRSGGRYMWVIFRADHSTNSIYEGFKATFTAEDKPSTSWALIIGVPLGVVVFIALVCCLVCVAKRQKTPSRAAGVGMPMTGTTAASHATQPGVIHHPPHNPIQQPTVNPYAPPPVGYAPVPADPSSPPPAYPYPPEPPPPYPGKETVPQYPPPGQPYPWLQSASAPSAPPQSP